MPTFDADAAAFRAPSGAYAILHGPDGDTNTRSLAKSFSACLTGPGAVTVRFALEPGDGGRSELSVVGRDGAEAAVACIIDRTRKERPWPTGYEPASIELFVVAR